MAGTRRALLIGIDRYPNLAARYQLSGCVNDVKAMAGILEHVFVFAPDHIELLTDEAASRDAILAALDGLAERSGSDDVVVVHYSGHGSQMTDREGDEPDGIDETIVPSDSGRGPAPNRDITDDEIHVWLGKLTERTSNVTLIFDSCHSGTITRDAFGAAERWVEPDLRPVEELPPSPVAATTRGVSDGPGPSRWLPMDAKHVLIAGCRDGEVSSEYPPVRGSGTANGAMTFFLVQELSKAEGGATYRDAFERAAARVTAVYPRQHPQLEGRADRELFGVRDLEPMRFVPIVARGNGMATLGAGAAHGLVEGTVFDVYPQGTKQTDGAVLLGRLEVAEVRPVEADARVVEESSAGAVARGTRAIERSRPASAERLAVNLQVPDEWKTAADLRGKLESSAWLRAAGTGEPADYRVYVVAPRQAADQPVPQLGPVDRPTWATVGPDGRLAAPVHAVDEPDAALTVFGNLERLARFRRGLALANPYTELRGKVGLDLLRIHADGQIDDARPESAGGQVLFEEGDRVALRITNRAPVSVFVAVLDFGVAGRIALLEPLGGLSEEVPPGQSFFVGRRDQDQIKLGFPEQFPFAKDPGEESVEGIETFKLFASTGQPVDFTPILQEGTRGGVEGLFAGRSATTDAVWLALGGIEARDTARPVAAALPGKDDWITVDRTFALRRRQAREDPPTANGGKEDPVTNGSKDVVVSQASAEADKRASPPASTGEADQPAAASASAGAAAPSRPTISQQPESQTVVLGQKAHLSVAAAGDGLSYQWRRDGTSIDGAKDATYEFLAREADDGVGFTVDVTNQGGTVTSDPATLTVVGETPWLYDPAFARKAAWGLVAVLLVVVWPLWLLAVKNLARTEATSAFPSLVAVQLVIVGVVVALGGLYLWLLDFRGRSRTWAEIQAAQQQSAAETRDLSGIGDILGKVPDVLRAFGQLKGAASLLAISALLFLSATALAWRAESGSPTPTPTPTASSTTANPTPPTTPATQSTPTGSG